VQAECLSCLTRRVIPKIIRLKVITPVMIQLVVSAATIPAPAEIPNKGKAQQTPHAASVNRIDKLFSFPVLAFLHSVVIVYLLGFSVNLNHGVYSMVKRFFILYFMLIGELSKKTGFSNDTIRFYEKKGLIRVGKKDRRENRYKEYPEEALRRLELIRDIKEFGFTLEEIRELIFMSENYDNICEGMPEKVLDKINIIEEKIRLLNTFKSRLQNILLQCNGNCRIEDLRMSCGK
jgi:DNA-binding transcriptional MerR regulator